MSVPLILTFVSTVAFAIQFLIFVEPAAFVTLYFLAALTVNIMVLERARSERERLHARLRDAGSLATTGELAGGMAHEIRIRSPRSSTPPPFSPKVRGSAALRLVPGDIRDVVNHISALIRDNPRARPGSTGTSLSIRRCRALPSTAIRSIQVPPENLRHLFEPFYSGKPNGLGLDLTIAQRIAHAHGGRNGH